MLFGQGNHTNADQARKCTSEITNLNCLEAALYLISVSKICSCFFKSGLILQCLQVTDLTFDSILLPKSRIVTSFKFRLGLWPTENWGTAPQASYFSCNYLLGCIYTIT